MNTLTKKEVAMSSGKITPLLFKFGIPTMIGMVINAVYNLVDTYFVGGFGMLPTAAVSLLFPVTLLSTGIGCLFGSGTGSSISRLLGSKKYQKAKEYSATSLVSAILLGIIISALLLIFLKPVLTLLGADKDTLPYAVKYGHIIIAGLTLSGLNVTANNIIVSEGQTVFTSINLILGAVLNIILDALFVKVFHTGIEGVAYSTVISSAVSSVLYITYFLGKSKLLRFSIKNIKPSKELYANICKIGIPMLIFQILNMAVITITNKLSASYGNDVIASFGITYKLFCIETNAAFGFLKGYQPLAGYNYGAAQYKRVNSFTKNAIIITTVFCLLCNIIFALFAPEIITLFNKDSIKVLHLGSKVLRLQAIGYSTLGFQFVGASYFLAIGKAKQGGILSMSRGLIFIVLSLILNAIFNVNGLIASFIFTELIASAITGLMLSKK